MLQRSRLSAFPDCGTEWRVESFSLITVAGPCRTYTGFPFMPLRAPRILLGQSDSGKDRMSMASSLS
jgi:hypothetical protein